MTAGVASPAAGGGQANWYGDLELCGPSPVQRKFRTARLMCRRLRARKGFEAGGSTQLSGSSWKQRLFNWKWLLRPVSGVKRTCRRHRFHDRE